MNWEEGTLEQQMDAPKSLKYARNYLDRFHEGLEVSEDQQELYAEAKELEVEFEKALFYGMSAPKAILHEVSRQVNDMTSPEKVREVCQDKDEDYRKHSREQLDKAENVYEQMMESYEEIADEETRSLEKASERYGDVFEYAEDLVENWYNVDVLIQSEINQKMC